ncbi:MAG: cytochrome c [Acidobacteriota bacterium]
MSTRRKTFRLIAAVLALGFVLIGYSLWFHLARKGEPAIYDDPETHFKYGALGLKPGFPYYLWTVMPEVFADLLPAPGGWEVFGMIEEGRGYPVGFAKQTVGFPGLSPNCALCHTGRYRTSETSEPVTVPGGPAGALDFQAFNDFVFAAAKDPRFRSDVLMPAITERFELSFSERLVYRYVLLPTVGKTLQKQAEGSAWLDSRPPSGHGRFDAFNLFKITVLGLDDDGTTGASDYPPLWHQGAREGQYLHWNGSGNQLREDNLMSVYPLNQGPSGFLEASFDRVVAYLRDVPPAAFPFAVDVEAAARGRVTYDAQCASCHAFDGDRVGQVTAQSEVGTDPEFLEMWSVAFVDALEAIDSPPFRFPSLRRTDGYLNVPLDGAWMRAPYLHNGSVPSLRALLSPVAERPATFHRGSEIYDPEAMGFRSSTGGAGTSLYDVSLRGNSNAGHTYGVDLTDEAKHDLLEFLKTL